MPPAGSRLAALVVAELRKMWASWIPLAFLLATVAVTSAFAFEVYRVELPQDPVHPTAAQALSGLLFATWQTLLFPAALIAFCAFWTTLDSQYGMIRVTCSQPLSRSEYVLGRWLAVSGYVVLFTVVFVGAQVAWALLYSGAAAMAGPGLARLGRFSAELLAFLLALAWMVMAVASLRRTIGGGIVTAYLLLIGLALMTTLPYDVVSPRLVFMRYFFFAHQELVDPWAGLGYHDSPFVRVHGVPDFWRVVLGTPLAFVIPALLYFRRRDVTE